MSSEALSFGPPPRSEPSPRCEGEGFSVDVELDSVEGMELELGDEVWVGVADVLEEELIESG